MRERQQAIMIEQTTFQVVKPKKRQVVTMYRAVLLKEHHKQNLDSGCHEDELITNRRIHRRYGNVMSPGPHVAQHSMTQQQGPKVKDSDTITDGSSVLGTNLRDPPTVLPDLQAEPSGMLSSPVFLPILGLPNLSLPPLRSSQTEYI